MNEFLETNELGLVTGLITLGYPPLERRREKKEIIFVFENTQEIERLRNDFYNNRMDVDARNFHTTMKALKTSIYKDLNENK